MSPTASSNADMASTRALARRLGAASAGLILLGLVTGFLVAGAMTGTLGADPHAMLASHLNALMGAFWMLGIAWSLPLLELSAGELTWLVRLAVVANYANWGVTAVKSFLRVAGLEANGHLANDAVFVLLTTLVVVPALGAAGLWLRGFTRAS
jgi:hydroxylaminobenzene mutase